MILLAPSILGADFKRLGEEIQEVDQAGAEYIHLDVMDGIFVPSISFGMPLIESVRGCTRKVFDVHMMVEEPARYTKDMKRAGADLICVHAEACRHLDRTLRQIKESGLMAGVALNPATPPESIRWILREVDLVLVMTVNPGFGGQKLLPCMPEKIRAVKRLCQSLDVSPRIEVDGGITLENTATVLEAGADVIVAGSSVFKGSPGENVRSFKRLFAEFEKGLETGKKTENKGESPEAGK